ncbi:surfeit locus protein 2-like [Corticium candelabrum]|uniref:surfeit locus protein 2-like n=1 Tax=Corticium candelabrum TaxID=121492 RepID=UPI002E252508|nr:surfeit locus protein 2-like [Corticium candelabrum]
MTSDVNSFLKQHPEFQTISDRDKVLCTLTGHEMPGRLDVLQQYVQGKKYKKAKKMKEYDFDKHRPHLVQHKKLTDYLQCQLTRRIIIKSPDAVERHVLGKRYQKALSQWASKESGHDAGYSDSETGEIENQLEEGEEENETDSEVDEERDDCSDLYPLELLQKEVELELKSHNKRATNGQPNGKNHKKAKSADDVQTSEPAQSNRRKRKSRILKKAKRSKLTQTAK